MRDYTPLCSAILALVWATNSMAVITSDAPGSHSVVPGTFAFGLNLDGVVSFELPESGGTVGTGVLIGDRHILTAAHVAEFVDQPGYQARFYLPTGNLNIDLLAGQGRYPDRWAVTAGNDADIAVLELATDAPAAAPRYTLYGLDNEVGKSAVVAGHGAIGLGSVGGRDLINDLVLHAGLNRIEARGEDLSDDIYDAAPGDMLVFDFDSGQPANNVLGLPGISSDLGFGPDEVGVFIGDSGGPLFIDGAIAGLHRAIFGGLDGDYTPTESDGSWGELVYATRVSSFRDFITSATDGQAVFEPMRSAWNIDASGNWSAVANWSAVVPNAAGSQAVFGAAITSPRSVAVDIPVTVGRIELDSTHAYTLAGDAAITLDAVSGDALIDVVTGNHVIAAPITLSDHTLVTVASADSNLSMTGALGASGFNLTKAGAGMLTLNNVRAAGLSIKAGTVAMTPSADASVLGSLTIAGGATPTAKLDLNNAAIIDYTGASPAAAVRQQVLSGRGGPGLGAPWNGQGITSSAAAAANATDAESRCVGYAENSALPLGPYTTFRGQAVDDTSLLMAFTRTGDANLDGLVNDDDVTIVGASYAPGVSQPFWALGDFDYNGFVDDDDVTLLGVFYDPSALPLAVSPLGSTYTVAAVPEPGTLMLAALAGLLLAAAPCLTHSRRRGG